MHFPFSCFVIGSNNAAKQPRLFTFSARTQEGLNTVLDLVQKERSEDMEMQALLQELSDTSCTSHPYRGYAILNQEGNVKDAQVRYFKHAFVAFLRIFFLKSARHILQNHHINASMPIALF